MTDGNTTAHLVGRESGCGTVATKAPVIAIHGFGTYAILYYHLIAHARISAPDIKWLIILPTSHHLDVFAGLLQPSQILCLEDQQSGRIITADPEALRGYAGNIYADIEAAKQVFKHRPGAEQLALSVEIYRIYKRFLQKSGATHVLFGHVETVEGKILISVAEELGLPAMLPTDLRNIGGMCFSPDARESLPSYRQASRDGRAEAVRYIAEFRERPKQALNLVLEASGEEPLPTFEKSLSMRIWNHLRRAIRKPRLFELPLFLISVKYAFPVLRETIRGLRAVRNRRQADMRDLSALPAKFIYYPLQTTPESSINTPAPFFIDQMRAIDAVRFAMPSDCTLVVKEHPASVGVRPAGFYRALKRRAGVVLADCDISSLELIKRAGLTISVTGTATLEAFLLGRASLVLGHSFIAEYLGGVCSLQDLPRRIRERFGAPPSDDEIVNALAEIISTRYPCVLRPADEPGSGATRPTNIRRLLAAVIEHIDRLRDSARPGANSGTLRH